jgi:hypothetical protein
LVASFIVVWTIICFLPPKLVFTSESFLGEIMAYVRVQSIPHNTPHHPSRQSHRLSSLGQPLDSSLLFDYPTLEALVEYIAQDVLQIELEEAVESELQQKDMIQSGELTWWW